MFAQNCKISVEKVIKMTSLVQYNFEKYRRMTIKDLEGKTFEKRKYVQKRCTTENREAKKICQFQGGMSFAL